MIENPLGRHAPFNRTARRHQYHRLKGCYHSTVTAALLGTQEGVSNHDPPRQESKAAALSDGINLRDHVCSRCSRTVFTHGVHSRCSLCVFSHGVHSPSSGLMAQKTKSNCVERLRALPSFPMFEPRFAPYFHMKQHSLCKHMETHVRAPRHELWKERPARIGTLGDTSADPVLQASPLLLSVGVLVQAEDGTNPSFIHFPSQTPELPHDTGIGTHVLYTD